MFGDRKNKSAGSAGALEKFRNSYIIIAVAYVVFGLSLLIRPQLSTTVICYAVGALCLIYAAVTLIKYFTDGSKRYYVEPNFVLPVILGIFGLVIIVRPAVVISILPVTVGLVLIVSGIVKLQDSFSLKRYGFERWYISLVFAVVSLLFGVIILLNPFGTGLVFARIVGALFAVDGILSIISCILVYASQR